MFSFKSAKEYYDNGDISTRVDLLNVPTLFISTRDDQIAGLFVPLEEI